MTHSIRRSRRVSRVINEIRRGIIEAGLRVICVSDETCKDVVVCVSNKRDTFHGQTMIECSFVTISDLEVAQNRGKALNELMSIRLLKVIGELQRSRTTINKNIEPFWLERLNN